MRLFKYFNARTVVLSIIIVIFTTLSMSFKNDIDNMPLWWEPAIIITCAILATLVVLDRLLEYSKYYEKYINITKVVCLFWYFLFIMVMYKHLIII